MSDKGDKTISTGDLKKVTYTFIVKRDQVGVLVDEVDMLVYNEGLCKANLGLKIDDPTGKDLEKASIKADE